jgi:hypothetical protein
VRTRHSIWEKVASTGLPLLILVAPAVPAAAEPKQVIGYAGALGEWELTAVVTEEALWWTTKFSGPLSMKHVGMCTQDGPEEKTGEIQFQISAISSRLEATLLVEGVKCSYSAGLSEPYSGMMICPDRDAVPLKLWLK